MARRRGFFAELQHQAQLAEKRRRQQQAAAYRARVSAVREAERAQAAAERARQAAARASMAERARLEKEAARMHAESQMAEVASRNASVRSTLNEIDGMLAATLAVDDYVDLESLKITVEHPPFDARGLDTPFPALPPLVYPPEPVYEEPPAPGGLFGAKKKHEQVVQRARAEFEAARQQWHAHATRMHAEYVVALQKREHQEAARLKGLAGAKARYEQECRQREADAKLRNEELAKFINDLAFDVESAIQQYIDIVLSNSVYPDAFPVTHDDQFDLATRELTLAMTVPPPSAMPTVKEYRYVKAKDEITATLLPLAELKGRYANAVFQVAVRTLHEVFEADRNGKVRSVALTVVTRSVSPATGLEETIPLVVTAADRERFTAFDLGNVVPHATLQHLGAALSKSPYDLTPADTSRGVRLRGQSR
jgi:restriction system protein